MVGIKTEIISLSPDLDSVIFNKSYRDIWKFNQKSRFIDVSYLQDKIKCELYNINHQYFYQILELIVQHELGERDYSYFEKYSIQIIQGLDKP
jgi:hypothetical protein